MSVRVRVIKLDEDHRIYLYSKRIVYKERRGGKLVTKFSGVDFNALLNSPVIDDKIKEKLRKIVQNLT